MPKIGFWHSAREPHLPVPVDHPDRWAGQSEFVARLRALEGILLAPLIEANTRLTDYHEERERLRESGVQVPPYGSDPNRPPYPNEADMNVVSYRGSSRCRVCECMNGYHEYRVNGWEWPSGYRHYLAEHNVRPDPAFKEFILEATKDMELSA